MLSDGLYGDFAPPGPSAFACTQTIITRHISVAPDFQALVRISDLTVIAGDAMPSQIAEALAWAETRQEWLALKWAELNQRG